MAYMASPAPTPPVITEISDSDARDLMAQSQALQASLYPPESIHQVAATELATDPNVLLGAFMATHPDTAIGCVGWLRGGPESDTAEVKSLFVTPEARGHGIGSALMEALEQRARASGISLLRLETGIYQPESVALYTGRGYSIIARFGEYPDDPLSVFMEKRLA